MPLSGPRLTSNLGHSATARLRGMAMHWATIKMRLLVTIVLLKREGVSKQLLQQAFRDHYLLGCECTAWTSVTEAGTKEDSDGV